jgi:small conductance mechanosensitive channel
VLEQQLAAIDFNKLTSLAMFYGLNTSFALLILIFGWIGAKFIKKIAMRAMRKAQVDPTLRSFLANISHALVLAFVVIAALNKLGIQTASLVAVIGAAGLAIGLALQGSLSNFAAGVMIIIFKHFRVGDFIEAAGQLGTVESLDIFNTIITTPDNQKVVIPNSMLTQDVIKNYTVNDKRRIDLTIGIGYGDDIAVAKSAIRNVIESDQRVLKNEEILVAVKELGASSVDLAVRCWTKTDGFWDVYFDMVEAIKLRLDKEGVSIPFPQRDVHLYSANVLEKQAVLA